MGTATIELPRLHPGQIELEAVAKRFNVVANGRRWGKTYFLTRRACKRAIAGEKFGWFCQEYSFLLEAFDAIRRRLSPIIKRADRSSAPMIIETVTGGIIEFWSLDNPDAGRSRKYHEVCIDEAGIVKKLADVWRENIRATLLDYQGMAWFMGTPKGRNDFYLFFERSGEGDWGSFTRPTSNNPYISNDEIESMRTEPGMTERAFLQEVEAQFLADEGEVFAAWMFEDRIVEPNQVPNFVRWYRGFDTATGDKSWNDDTATVKVCYDQIGNMWLRGFKTKKLTPAELNNWAKEIILGDGLTTYQVIEAHNTGYGIAGFLQRQPGYEKLINLQKIGRAQGGKRQRAGILASMAEDKKVYIVKEGEYQKFYDQLLNFTGYVDGEQDDLIDAVSVVTTFIKEQKSAYEQIKVTNPYNPSNSPSARAFARLQASER